MTLMFQNTDFTCGPICLKMAMRRLDPKRPLKEVNEFLIWREANSVFMGYGHPGCTHFGLAGSALKRGFSAEIYSDNLPVIERQLQKDVFKENEKRIYALVHEHDKKMALSRGLVIRQELFSSALIRQIIEEGKVALMLVRAFVDQEEHWILIDGVKGDYLTVIDPFEKHASHPSAIADKYDGQATHRLDFAEMEQYCLHGKDKAYLILAIGPRAAL